MKTKFTALIACMLIVCILATFTTLAQQPQYAKPENAATQIAGGNAHGNYTYHVFVAPNKMFGYDIFLNGKIILHQAASSDQPNISAVALAKKEHAEKAAAMAIEKIKRAEPATLTGEEIKKIMVQ
jgi:hypothetical protein